MFEIDILLQKVEDTLKRGFDDELIVDCNALSAEIDNKIVTVHNFISDKYGLKFPELKALVPDPIDYARVVKRIGNEMDVTVVDLEGYLPSAMIMVVCVTASSISGKPLPEDVLQKTIDACDGALALDSAKKNILDFIESRMVCVAPNLSAIVGSCVAAKLIDTAGGLSALANMPACDVLLLGTKKNNNLKSQFGDGCYLEETEIFQTSPPPFKIRVCRLLASKSTLAARVDSTRGDPSGKSGTSFRADMHKKIEKWQEPPPARQPKPLPVPADSEPKKKRGGRRLRKTKERYGITDTRKLVNRVQFGVPEVGQGYGIGQGYGMLGPVSLRIAAKLANKKRKETSFGLTQGIELSIPLEYGGTQSTYFSETGTFSKKIKRT